MNDTDYLPAEIYNSHNQPSENRQGLSQLLDTSFFGARPILPERLARFGYFGGEALKVRRPDIGEVGLSKSELDHAIQYGITMWV